MNHVITTCISTWDLPQLRPTPAICNYKHPQSPDHRRLPALPKSTDNPQLKSSVSPVALFDASLAAINPTLLPLLLTSFPSNPRNEASHIILSLRSKTYTMHRPQLQLPRLCRPQVFKALLKSTISQTPPKNHCSLRENNHFLLLPFPCSSYFSESTEWKEHKSCTLLLSVCQHGEKSHYLSCNYIIAPICVYVHCALSCEGKGHCEKILCVCVCVCKQRAGCIIIYTVV